MKRILIVVILLTGVLISCNKGDNSKDDSNLKQDDLSEKIECLEMVFPLSFVMPDGSLITGESREEIGSAIKEWYEENPGIEEKPVMEFPVNANFKGRPVTISNHEEMMQYKKVCAEEKERCFVFIYPITYIMPDESTITINSADDRENRMAIKLWYQENPGHETKPALQYPVKIKIIKTGKIKTLNNDEEMGAIKRWCREQFKPTNG